MECSPCAALLIAALAVIAILVVMSAVRMCGAGSRSGYLVYGPYNDLDEIGARGQYYALEEDPGAGGAAGGWV